MIIYRIYDLFITFYCVKYECNKTGNFEILHANWKLYLTAILTAVGVWLVLELLFSFGLFFMAKRRKIQKRYRAFIPFVNMLFAGKLAGETQLFGQRVKRVGVFVMISQILAMLLSGFTIYADVILNSNFYIKAITSAEGEVVSQVYVTVSGGSPTSKFAIFLINYCNISVWLRSIVELAYSIFAFIMASALFRRYAPSSFSVLAMVSLFVPVAFPVIVFVLSHKEPIDYEEYVRKRREAYYRQFGGYGGYGGYRGNYGSYGYGGYGNRGGNYGSASSGDPFRENGEENANGTDESDEPFAELGGSGNQNNDRSSNETPFSDIDG